MIYHLTTRNAALSARQAGVYRTPSLAQDGFIHLSQRHQVIGVANAFYAGQTDLVLLVVDPSRLKAELKYEAPVHPATSAQAPAADERFPHLYGPLNFEAVLRVVELPLGADGTFVLPAEIQE